MNKGLIAAIVAIALVIIGAVVYWQVAGFGNGPPSNQATQGQTAQKPAGGTTPKPPTGPPAKRYCADDHDKADTKHVTRAGGLIQILQHENALDDAYDCASAYLDQGGDVNAADPRDDSAHLTPLLFAIKRNDPKMVHFMLDHDADPTKRGGSKNIKPYGYAVFQALHHRSTDYTRVIGMLDSALGDHPASSSGS